MSGNNNNRPGGGKNGGDFQSRFEHNYSRMTAGMIGGISPHILKAVYLGSGLLTYLFFANKMPGLFLDPAKFPTLAPLISGLFGFAVMEVMVVAWNWAMCRDENSKPQMWTATIGLVAALAFSVLTSFAAIFNLIGQEQAVVSDLAGAVEHNGLAFYVSGQILLAALYLYIFPPDAQDARHIADVKAKERESALTRQRSLATGKLAADKAVLADAHKLGGMHGRQSQIAYMRDFAKSNNLSTEGMTDADLQMLFGGIPMDALPSGGNEQHPARNEQRSQQQAPRPRPPQPQNRPPSPRPTAALHDGGVDNAAISGGQPPRPTQGRSD